MATDNLRALWQRFTLTRYLAASVIALAFDTMLFLALTNAGLHPALASTLGYIAGIGVHWLISANLVFAGKVHDGAMLMRQRLLFVASALLGLGLTVGIVTLTTSMGAQPILAKSLAVGISFITVYAVRKWGIFR